MRTIALRCVKRILTLTYDHLGDNPAEWLGLRTERQGLKRDIRGISLMLMPTHCLISISELWVVGQATGWQGQDNASAESHKHTYQRTL